LRDAAAQLKAAAGELSMVFDGFTEADKLCRGEVDVAVTDGFSGNIALKAVEGTARFVGDLLRRSFASSLRSKIGFLISRPATELLKHHLDPNNHNGAVFLGLNGVVVKSHGSANALGVANAVGVTQRLLEENLTERISADLDRLGAETIRNSAKSVAEFPSDSQIRAHRDRQRFAGPHRHQRRTGGKGGHQRRVDRRAYRHPQPPYRR
jgi:glycerol-3-phosphate acyltransferase PlsX